MWLPGIPRKKRPKTDNLFQLSTAYLSIQAKLSLRSTGRAALLVKPIESTGFDETRRDLESILARSGLGLKTETVRDEYNYLWIRLRDEDFEDLLAAAEMAAQTMGDEGIGDRLLSAIFEFEGADRRLLLIYDFREGNFYPFSPTSSSERDTGFELRFKGLMSEEMSFEKDLEKWYPVWNPML